MNILANFFVRFFLPVSYRNANDHFNEMNEHIMKMSEYREKARALLEYGDELPAYDLGVASSMFGLIAKRFIMFNGEYKDYPMIYNRNNTATLDPATPSRECYEFINIMMTVYDRVDSKVIDEPVVVAIKEWLKEE